MIHLPSANCCQKNTPPVDRAQQGCDYLGVDMEDAGLTSLRRRKPNSELLSQCHGGHLLTPLFMFQECDWIPSIDLDSVALGFRH